MAEEKGRYKKIIVPIDGSGWSERAIPHAMDIARDNNSEVILLHVFKPPANEYVGDIALAGQEEQLMALRDEAKQRLTAIRNNIRAEQVNVRVQFIEGTGVASIICDYINDEGGDLVVMSSHGHTGITRWLFGSIAQKVMQGVNVPVLLIRPEKDVQE